MEELTKFDVAEYLDTDELQTLYLDEVAKENDPSALIKAIDTVVRAKGMTKTAKEAGISREGLYKALSQNGNPSFATVCKILNAIGYTLVPERIAKKTEAYIPQPLNRPKVPEATEIGTTGEILRLYEI